MLYVTIAGDWGKEILIGVGPYAMVWLNKDVLSD